MFTNWLRRKLEIICRPLPYLTSCQRRFLKSLLFCFDQLITVENLNQHSLKADPVIFALNHNNSCESLLVPAYLIFQRQGRKIGFIVDWMFGHIPLLGWVFNQIEPIYVYNKPSTIKSLNKLRKTNYPNTVYDNCINRLKQGKSIGIFPEGSRNQNPQFLLKGRKGIGYIVLQSQAPVLPIGIDFPVRRHKDYIPKFGRIILRGGRKLVFSEEIALYHQIQNNSYVHPTMKKKITEYLAAKVTYHIMKELANLSGKQYPFQQPLPAAEMKRFFYDPALTG